MAATVREISVNMDQPCTSCGQMGAVNSTGICLECVAKRVTGERIGPKSIGVIMDRIGKHLSTYYHEINEAYLKCDELTIGFSVKVKQSKVEANSIEITTGITFVADKIKDDSTDLVNEAQGDLFK